jgi:hypothetical protein
VSARRSTSPIAVDIIPEKDRANSKHGANPRSGLQAKTSFDLAIASSAARSDADLADNGEKGHEME